MLFEDVERGHKSRKAKSLYKLEKKRKGSPPRALKKNETLMTH